MVQLMAKFEVVPLTIYGTNAVGVYVFANNKYALIPQDAPQRLYQGVIDALSVEIVPITIAKSNLIGIFVAGNDNGVLLPSIATDDEVNQLRKSLSDINIEVIPTKYTALSNLLLVNNRVALVSSIIEKELLRRIADVLDTEVIQGELCGSYVIGSIALVNDNG
ncbi:MAG: translation initiation factor 6, partial [Thermocladium sp.]